MSETFGSRLREERMRITPKQGDFASLLGVRQSLLSEWEKDATNLKADHLAQLSDAGIDIQYVVTGRRGGELLGERESILLDAFRSLDALSQGAVLLSTTKMAQYVTPRAVLDALVSALPSAEQGSDVLDPGVGTGGMLRSVHNHLKGEDQR